MPAHTGHTRAWEKTVAVYRENGKIAACVWNEGCYSGEQVFLFDSRQRAEDREEYEVRLPEGYTFADGHTTPDFYLSNVHRAAFANSGTSRAGEHGKQAFHELRAMRYYRKDLDVCVLDPMGRPVAMGMLWYSERMPYCELESLGVVW